MPSYRYWRVSQIKARTSTEFKGIAILQFLDESGSNLATNPAKGFASHYYQMPSIENAPANAFDGNPNTWTEVKFNNIDQDWFIGYDFGVDVSIEKVGVAGRNDLPLNLGREWQTAKVDVSSDGINWINYGTIEPYIAAEDSSLVIVPIISPHSLSVSAVISNSIITPNIYSDDESGSFSGAVTQGESGQPKTPLKAEVLLYDRLTNRLLQRTWSSDLGTYSFNGLDAGREYYAVTLHPNRTYNAAIQDGLTSGMTA